LSRAVGSTGRYRGVRCWDEGSQFFANSRYDFSRRSTAVGG